MRMYLLQHGDAMPETVDPDRPLSEKGRLDVKRLARFLGWSALRVRRVVHSGKTRARQTAELMAHELAEGIAPEALSGLSPNDPVESIVDELGRWQEDTLLVGHMPFVGRLASRLLAGDEALVSVAFQPGSLACLERDAAGHCSLAWMLRPELLQG